MPGLQFCNLAHLAGFITRQICKRPADRGGFYDRNLLALFDVVSGTHKHLRDASLEGRRDSYSLARNHAIGTQQHARDTAIHVEDGAAHSASEQPAVQHQPAKTFPVDTARAKLSHIFPLSSRW